MKAQAETTILAGYQHGLGGPELVIDSPGEYPPRRARVPVVDRVFTMRVFDDTYCVGRYDIETLDSSPCPKGLRTSKGNSTCPACWRANGFNPAFYNVERERLSPKQAKYNNEPHVVYLAFFSASAIKVGIANLRRHRNRLLEQGARAAVVLAVANDAYAARAIERAAVDDCGFLESVSSSRKLQFLALPFEGPSALRALESAAEKARRTLCLEPPKDLDAVSYDACYFPGGIPAFPMVDLSRSTPLTLSGRGVGMVGDILVTTQNDTAFLLSLKKALSHCVVITPDERENPRGENHQQALF